MLDNFDILVVVVPAVLRKIVFVEVIVGLSMYYLVAQVGYAHHQSLLVGCMRLD